MRRGYCSECTFIFSTGSEWKWQVGLYSFCVLQQLWMFDFGDKNCPFLGAFSCLAVKPSLYWFYFCFMSGLCLMRSYHSASQMNSRGGPSINIQSSISRLRHRDTDQTQTPAHKWGSCLTSIPAHVFTIAPQMFGVYLCATGLWAGETFLLRQRW